VTAGFGELAETIIVIHPLQRDEWGDPVPGTGTEVEVQDCLFAPGATREIEVNQNTVLADATIFAPSDIAVSATDRVRVRGEEYTVAGKPRVWRNTMTEIPVRLVSG
jgi:hypothetical protein